VFTKDTIVLAGNQGSTWSANTRGNIREEMKEYVKKTTVEGVRKYPRRLRLFDGAKVVLTENSEGGNLVRFGLYNGSQGCVRGVVGGVTGDVELCW
jgi:hypothetical protein